MAFRVMISILPLGAIQSSFVLPKSFIISTPLLNQKSNQNDFNLSSDKLSFYLVSENLHLTFKNQTECTGDLICAFLCEPQKACECGQSATLTFAILFSTCEGVSKRVINLLSKNVQLICNGFFNWPWLVGKYSWKTGELGKFSKISSWKVFVHIEK